MATLAKGGRTNTLGFILRLLGGIPFGTNVLIYGPPFTGKEVLVNSFVGEGLKMGIPAIWVITEKSPKEIREEMMYVLSGYEEYEKKGSDE